MDAVLVRSLSYLAVSESASVFTVVEKPSDGRHAVQRSVLGLSRRLFRQEPLSGVEDGSDI